MEKQTKKEITAQYKERDIIGGVYLIRNLESGKLFLDVDTNIGAIQNRFNFAVRTNTCVQMKLQKDWNAQKGQGFEFEVLETLEKDNGQSTQEFKADLAVLKEIWQEKLSGSEFY
ncbi:MAG: GIY-YIG nuclease family protein [Turicibacter sp.]|nr:GIY-YIG nuclease family protein [Turicibacter sp.]